jgi:hypothetical protein
LLCREVHIDPQFKDSILVGRMSAHATRSFPTAARIGFFVRLTSARGSYEVEIQLHDEAGQIVWRDGPAEPWQLDDPLAAYDLVLNLNPVFLAAGAFDFVLVVGGEELARERFTVALAPKKG